MHCRKLLRQCRALGRHGGLCRWTVLTGLCLGVHELSCWAVPNNHNVDELHELSHGNLSRNDRREFVGDLRSMHCWELLRHDGTLGRYRHLRCWAILPGFGIVLHELPCGSISSECDVDELHELPHGHVPRHDRGVVVGDLRSLHCRKLLWHDGALGRDGHLHCW
jgi:hypothetical protein